MKKCWRLALTDPSGKEWSETNFSDKQETMMAITLFNQDFSWSDHQPNISIDKRWTANILLVILAHCLIWTVRLRGRTKDEQENQCTQGKCYRTSSTPIMMLHAAVQLLIIRQESLQLYQHVCPSALLFILNKINIEMCLLTQREMNQSQLCFD